MRLSPQEQRIWHSSSELLYRSTLTATISSLPASSTKRPCPFPWKVVPSLSPGRPGTFPPTAHSRSNAMWLLRLGHKKKSNTSWPEPPSGKSLYLLPATGCAEQARTWRTPGDVLMDGDGRSPEWTSWWTVMGGALGDVLMDGDERSPGGRPDGWWPEEPHVDIWWLVTGGVPAEVLLDGDRRSLGGHPGDP